LWYPDTPPATREKALSQLGKRFDFIATALSGRPFLTGDRFGIADAYLYTILSWSRLLKLDLAPWPALVHYLERVGARPSVHEAKRVESGSHAVAA
jgi:glutathione S-transferase